MTSGIDVCSGIPLEPSLKHLTSSYGAPSKSQNEFLQDLGKPHVDSFNHLIEHGLHLICQNLMPVHLTLADDLKLFIFLTDLRLMYPIMPDGSGAIKTQKIYPSECRQRGGTYKAHLYGKIQWSLNGVLQIPIEKDFGEIPVMVKSNRCHLKGLTPSQLIEKGEHENEWGGYFIVKGHERLIRMLVTIRRNYPIAVSRRSWKQRGAMFSDKGIFLRCVADDLTSTNNVLHFVTDGTVKLMIGYRKSLYFIPLCLILKCLINATDLHIFKCLMEGKEDDSYYRSCVRTMLQTVHVEGLDTHAAAKSYVGKNFRIKFPEQPSWVTDEQICDLLLEKCLAIHLKNNEDKFNLLVFMTQKLFAFVEGKCCEEGADALMVQEVLTGGHVYQQVLKDKLQSVLNNIKIVISKKISYGTVHNISQNEMATFCKRGGNIQSSLENFIGTGNVSSHYGSGLPQDKGLTIIAENINRMRYMSHFKSVHRGAFFVEMRTTEARQLLPDAWGFICPVHTPDGAPCGLLNHLSKFCQVTDAPDQKMTENMPSVLFDLGVLPIGTVSKSAKNYSVLLDGRIIGSISQEEAVDVVNRLRILKIEGKLIPTTTEIVLIPNKELCTQYPGLYLFTGASRLLRPVRNLLLNKIELVGTLEQVYLDICVDLKSAYKGLTTHQELSKTSFLSNLASLIPMPDCNQSPRNMYQCQMGKQSMGTPCHTWNIQAETKLYRLLIPSSPLFRPAHYDYIKLDDFPMGVNAVVAVISYTGYDMEDAMIINKASFERGFGHGSILKSEFIDLKPNSYFERDPARMDLVNKLDEDGFPSPGVMVTEGDPICCYFDHDASKYVVQKFHGKEAAYVDNVRQCCGSTLDSLRGCITFRIPRNPTVGDKFASRAGQKGICSQLWPAEDLPFTDSGMVPDVVFNPHGFPSRMTIAMMIELMAGKSAAIHGKVHDATPFRYPQGSTAIDYFGKLLEAGGYSYYGTEKMYSGVDGREMSAAIFYGIVYYQRLRHMVLDKWQVRSTGAVDTVTQQPIKGRRRGGGVRFGEMERDSLISHGASSLVLDRLFDCSDRCWTSVCIKCHNLLSPAVARCVKGGGKVELCRLCPDGGEVRSIELPYIFRYLLIQLAAVNINLKVYTK